MTIFELCYFYIIFKLAATIMTIEVGGIYRVSQLFIHSMKAMLHDQSKTHFKQRISEQHRLTYTTI